MEDFSENHSILKQIQKDEEFLNLFCFIISKRLMVIDDVEYQGKNVSQMAYPFIPFEEIRYTSWILNNIAYRMFWSNYTTGLFSSEFIINIKKSLTALYDRDKRLKINPENFWVIEKDILMRMDKLSNEALTNSISHSIIINIPHTIPFTLRAKIF